MEQHGNVIFGGNGYSEEWHRMAVEERGLENLRTTADALPVHAIRRSCRLRKGPSRARWSAASTTEPLTSRSSRPTSPACRPRRGSSRSQRPPPPRARSAYLDQQLRRRS